MHSALWLPLFDELADPAVVIRLAALRGDATGPYDLVVGLPTGADVAAFAAAGATWWLTDFDPATVSVDEVRGVLRDGPA